MRTRFRTKLFVASVAAAAVSLFVAALLLSSEIAARQRDAIEQRLTDEAHLIADFLAAAPALQGTDLDREADRLGAAITARVTLIEENGHVVGDSEQTLEQLKTLENHGTRPEVIAARQTGAGSSQRHSATLGTDMLYVAVRASHPSVRYVRVALALTDVDAQLAAIRHLTLVALAAAIPVALAVAWLMSAPIARRVQTIARVANRYSAGDLTRPAYDFGSDELGTVARVLDASVQELGKRVDELSRDRARTDAMLSGMVEGVLVVDRQGRLQLVNRAARQMLHVETDAVGRPYLEVIRHPDIAAQLTTALEGHDVDSREFALSRDPSRTFVARAAPVTSTGGGAVLVLHDITDLRRADQIRRDFVANVSHELRTPLTAIRGYLEAVLDDIGNVENARRFLEIVARQSARMEQLVTDLLRLARLDARQETLDVAACDVRQLFAGAVADLTPTIEAKRQRVAIDVGGDATSVAADPVKLHDVLRNLLENAVNYSPDEATIALGSARDADGAITLTVADSGPGIPPADLGRVFERFYRVDKSRSRPGGTGLGLAIVKHLVELHGGSVAAANAPSGGAVFTVRLPDVPPQK